MGGGNEESGEKVGEGGMKRAGRSGGGMKRAGRSGGGE